MIVDERRPTRKYKLRERKKHPYKNRSSMCILERIHATTRNIPRGNITKYGGKVAPFIKNG